MLLSWQDFAKLAVMKVELKTLIHNIANQPGTTSASFTRVSIYRR